MKVLIAHDPDSNEGLPLADLQRAGFPPQCDASVVVIADVLLPPTPESPADPPAPVPARVQTALDTARQLATQAQAQLQAEFPSWTIAIETAADAPAWGIIRAAEAQRPDLVVVGAHRQSALIRLVLGSVSQKVLHEAPRSVRIVRRGTIDTYRPARLLIGIDGSTDAGATVSAVAARHWRSGTEVRLVAVVDSATDTAPAAGARLEQAAQRLTKPELTLSSAVLEGDAKEQLLAEADAWKADCIFVGARGLTAVERILLGSVSSTIAARAACSVEVVRPRG